MTYQNKKIKKIESLGTMTNTATKVTEEWFQIEYEDLNDSDIKCVRRPVSASEIQE